MRCGLVVADFTGPGGVEALGPRLGRLAETAEQAGFVSIAVMDHFFQISMNGPVEDPMLEAYTTLGYLAGRTSTVRLGAFVTAVHHRHPGVLVKTLTTLDVVSGGRAFLGIGAGWNEEESRALGVPYPPLAERFERLEETLRLVDQMSAGDDSPFHGRHVQLDRPLNSPLPVSRPRPPVLVGGSGEKKTLRLVAQYADACNLWPSPDLAHKLDVLRAHCADVGRDYDEIEKTIAFELDLGEHGERVDECLETLAGCAKLGVQTAHTAVKPVHSERALELAGELLLPRLAEL